MLARKKIKIQNLKEEVYTIKKEKKYYKSKAQSLERKLMSKNDETIELKTKFESTSAKVAEQKD